ncbi:MAG: class II aldolase/adducin family protein [Rhizobiaceae bacterium]|nr:class II aldolase/adducin family protein [Rhizobiaceae bacterium]
MSGPSTERTDKAEAVVAAARALEAAGLNRGASGNVSVRDGDTMLITPSALPAADLSAGQIARMTLADDPADRPARHPADGAAGTLPEWWGPLKPSSEWRFHRDIYRARADIGAVVHTHAPWSTVMAVARKPIPAVHYMIAGFGGPDIRLATYARFGTAELSRAVLAALEGRNGCLMANHGMVTVAPTLDRAVWLAGEMEALAHHYVHAALIGGAHVLTDAEVAEAAEAFKSYRPGG